MRLKQGDMNDATAFGDDPAAMARRWLDAGATEDGRAAMLDEFRRVGTMLPMGDGADLHALTRRLEAAAARLDRGA